MDMWAALTTAVENITGFFSDFFTAVTAPEVVPWVIIGVAVPLIGFLVGLFKRLIWGNN